MQLLKATQLAESDLQKELYLKSQACEELQVLYTSLDFI